MKCEKKLCQTNLWVGGVMTNEGKSRALKEDFHFGQVKVGTNNIYFEIQINVPGSCWIKKKKKN